MNNTIFEEFAFVSLSQDPHTVDLCVYNSHQLIKLLLKVFPPILTLNDTLGLQFWSARFQEALSGMNSFSNVNMIGSV